MGFKTEKELEDYLTDSGQWSYKKKQRTPAQLKKLSESMITEADKKPSGDILRNLLIEEMKSRDLDQDELRYMIQTKPRPKVGATDAQVKYLKNNFDKMKDNNKPFIKKPKPAAVNIPLPKIDFTPMPAPAAFAITMSPEDRAMEQRFNQIMEQDRKEKIRNQNSGLAGLLGGGSKLYE